MENIKMEALNLHLSTLITVYICKNIEGYYICEAKNLKQLNINDYNNGLNPKIIGCYAINKPFSYSKYYEF